MINCNVEVFDFLSRLVFWDEIGTRLGQDDL